jgi:hypothetical protein
MRSSSTRNDAGGFLTRQREEYGTIGRQRSVADGEVSIAIVPEFAVVSGAAAGKTSGQVVGSRTAKREVIPQIPNPACSELVLRSWTVLLRNFRAFTREWPLAVERLGLLSYRFRDIVDL